MKRIVLYVLIMAATLCVPVRGYDVGELKPVQVVMLSREEGKVILQTDTQDVGSGADVTAALNNLKATTAAEIYLDTARYLLVSANALDQVEALRPVLKKRVRICLAEGAALGEETGRFLRLHGQLPQLKNWKEGMELPVLTIQEKRLILTKKSEKSP